MGDLKLFHSSFWRQHSPWVLMSLVTTMEGIQAREEENMPEEVVGLQR